MANYEIVHIAIAPPDTLDANLVRDVAAVINKSPYDTRLLLVGQIPKIIAHCQSMQVAESMAQRLRDLGLLAIVCKDSDLHTPSLTFRAHTIEFKEGEVVFRDKGGQERRMESSNVFLILKGKKHNYIEEEKIDTKMKFSLPATVLMGGIPIWRRVRQQTKDTSLRSEYFMRLYDCKSSETSVEILQGHMNYSVLGTKMTLSSLTNFSTLATKLQEILPQAIFDDRLVKPSGVSASSSRVSEDIETNCKLIYLFYLVTRGLDSTA